MRLRRLNGLNCCVGCSFICGLWAAAAANAPQREDKQQQATQQWKQFNKARKDCLWAVFAFPSLNWIWFCFMKWNGMMKSNEMEKERANKAPHQRAQSEAASQQINLFFLLWRPALWGQPKNEKEKLIWRRGELWLLLIVGYGAGTAQCSANKRRRASQSSSPTNQLMKPNWMKQLRNEVGGMVWLSCFLHWACRSNYGIKGYMFCLQLPSIPASLPSSFIN